MGASWAGVQTVSAYQAQHWLTGTRGTWRQDPAVSCGGQLNDSGSHLLDVAIRITGLRPEWVSAAIDNRGAPVNIDSALTVRFEGGALASILVAGSASIDWWEDLSIHGDRGTAFYRNGQVWVARVGEREPSLVPPEQWAANGSLARDFVDLILGRDRGARRARQGGDRRGAAHRGGLAERRGIGDPVAFSGTAVSRRSYQVLGGSRSVKSSGR